MHSIDRTIPQTAINLVGFSLLEPRAQMQRYSPTWFNVWEAWLHKKANIKVGSQQWLLKRFGVDENILPSEALRKADYRDWLNGMSEACTQAVAQLGAKGAFRLRHEKNALIYADSWGETSTFEGVNSWRDALSVDILPKNIVRDYGIKDFTCKLRGERNGLMMALRVAQDCLNSGMVDNVILCGQFRSIPVLTFSETLHFPASSGRGKTPSNSQVSVERVGCLILRKAPGQGIALHLSDYIGLPKSKHRSVSALTENWQQYIGANTHTLFGVTPPALSLRTLQHKAWEKLPPTLAFLPLTDIYGDSGCMNPALAWLHLQQMGDTSGHSLLSVIDGQGSAWLLENWLQEATI